MKISIISISIMTALTSFQSFAQVCTAGAGVRAASNESPYAFDCPSDKGIATFSGGAKTYVKDFSTDIVSSGKEVVQQMADSTTSEISVLQNLSQEEMKLLIDLNEQQKKVMIDSAKAVVDQEMEYKAEIANKEQKSQRSVVGLNDTKEEILLIVHELDVGDGDATNGYNHVQTIIASMKERYDNDKNFQLPQEMKTSKSKLDGVEGCKPYDPKTHVEGELDSNCFTFTKAEPGKKLEKFWQSCSREKSATLKSIQKNASSEAVTRVIIRKQDNFEKASSEMNSSSVIKTKISSQTQTSCSETDLEYGLCLKSDGEKLEKEEYFEKLITNEIVENGNISASNFLTPVSVGGDTSDITEDELKSLKITNQMQKDASGNKILNSTVSDDTPPLIKTYRTSSQYYAANDFVDNLVNREAVSGINVNEKSEVGLHSKMLTRQSILSLAENSLMAPVQERMGESLSVAVAQNELTREGVKNESGEFEVLREDLNGASSADITDHEINRDYAVLSTSATDAANGGGITAFENASPAALKKMQAEAMLKSLKLSLKRLERNERRELLLATMVAQNANSKESVDYINELKRK